MKNMVKTNRMPVLILGISGICLCLRRLLYAVAVDENNLLPVLHPLEILLWLVTFLGTALVIMLVWRKKGSNRYEDNFSASVPAAAGTVLAAAAIGLTAVLKDAGMPGFLGLMWRGLGILSAGAMLFAAWCRYQGQRPPFLLHGVVCVFFAVHMVSHYQAWSGNPQLQDYFYDLGGIMLLMLFAYYQTAFDTDSGNRRMQLAAGLLAALWSFTAVSRTEFPLLYAACGIWALTDLCTLTPVSRRNMGAAEQQREE